MATQPPTSIPFPISTNRGFNPQESAGILFNCYADTVGDPQLATGPSKYLWRRSPGLSLQAVTSETQAYRGGLIVNNLAYEVWKNAYTLDVNGNTVLLGQLPGTRKISIARDQATFPDVVAVDPDNGAFILQAAGVPQSPIVYNGGGNLPQPNSVCFQDGYLFYTISDGRCFASPINSIGTINALTFITAQAKSDVQLLRGIAFNGWLWLFTTGHAEIWQDASNAAPAFPYSRAAVLEKGLVQSAAIAGFEVGFGELLWVAQDFGVYWVSPGQTVPTKVSPPDLDALIESQVRAGNQIEAGVYAFGGKKFWTISSPAWSWEFNLGTMKWNERGSLNALLGIQTRWRATCGHPAFNKWLIGDQQSGNLFWHDVSNFTEFFAPQLMRLESGPVNNFPNETRIARADFNFTFGTGLVVNNLSLPILGTGPGAGGAVRLQLMSSAGVSINDRLNVSGVGGTIEANGSWLASLVDSQHVDLVGSVFANPFTSGGIAIDVTAPPNAQAPVAAISVSKDGGIRWGNPLIRQIGSAQKTRRQRVSIKSMGQSGPMGTRFRLDMSDPVYTAFISGTMSSDPREIGT
jgi:hypothetical protein